MTSSSKIEAVGAHVFAGGFTMGVKRVLPVRCQYELHDFGRHTVEKRIKIPFLNAGRWEDWLDDPTWKGCRMCFGNPRCTGFSTITSGYDDTVRGPWAKCTKDIHDFCHFGAEAGMDLVIWESVQQAYGVGRPLLDYLRDRIFEPKGYRIAHTFINAASFGNAQRRRRYFFVAYRGGNFNVVPPKLPKRAQTVRDKIDWMADHAAPGGINTCQTDRYDEEDWHVLVDEEMRLIPLMHPGSGKHDLDWSNKSVREAAPKSAHKWDTRTSDIPFSLHAPYRLAWDNYCPTITSSTRNQVHPERDRTLTISEIARMMGWKCIPAGHDPVAQIAKGIVPEIGQWLAEQALLFFDGTWGADDWSTRWDPGDRMWRGESFSSPPLEKVLDMTRWEPELCDTTLMKT